MGPHGLKNTVLIWHPEPSKTRLGQTPRPPWLSWPSAPWIPEDIQTLHLHTSNSLGSQHPCSYLHKLAPFKVQNKCPFFREGFLLPSHKIQYTAAFSLGTAKDSIVFFLFCFVFLTNDFFFYFYLFILIYFWLHWVFLAAHGLSLVVASGDHSSSWCTGLSLLWPLLLRSTSSRCAGSVVVAHRPSCSMACGIFPDQGSNPCPLH